MKNQENNIGRSQNYPRGHALRGGLSMSTQLKSIEILPMKVLRLLTRCPGSSHHASCYKKKLT